MTLDAVQLTAYVTPMMQAAMQARATHDGHSMQQEMRLAFDEHLAPRAEHGGDWLADVASEDDW